MQTNCKPQNLAFLLKNDTFVLKNWNDEEYIHDKLHGSPVIGMHEEHGKRTEVLPARYMVIAKGRISCW